jgi:hypothetical protein
MFLLSLESRPAGETPGVQRPKCEDDQSPATTVEIWSTLLHRALSCRYPECIRDKFACTHGTCSEKERTLWYTQILTCLSIFIPPADKLFYQNVPHGATDSLHAQITPQTSYPKVSELRLPVSQITHIKHTYTHTHTHTHTVTKSSSFLGEELKPRVFEHRPPRRAAIYSCSVRSPNRPTYWGDETEEDQTDGASGMYENKKIRIKRSDSKNTKEQDHV